MVECSVFKKVELTAEEMLRWKSVSEKVARYDAAQHDAAQHASTARI